MAGQSSARLMRVRQKSSHRHLAPDVSRAVPGRQRQPLDAIIVPSVRRADQLTGAIELAADAGVLLVVLGSRHTQVDEVAEQVARIPGGRALVIDVPADHHHPDLTHSSSGDRFAPMSAGRRSDLSKKRNIGLLLARLRGWNKIMFLDDDITLRPYDLANLSAQLDNHQIVGFSCRSFPDNSVVCHANRLIGAPQDTFVTGAALGVHCADLPLPFFPDIYNEDWFFFSEHVARRELLSVGTASQRPYRPFADPARASHEEFGDLLAEGLYALMGAGDGLPHPSIDYWGAFAAARHELLDTIERQLLDRFETNESFLAVESIRASKRQIEAISAQDCADFMAAWADDRAGFAAATTKLSNFASDTDALDWLQLGAWRRAGFGNPDLARTPRPLVLSGSSSRR
jgi:hypothetical protein